MLQLITYLCCAEDWQDYSHRPTHRKEKLACVCQFAIHSYRMCFSQCSCNHREASRIHLQGQSTQEQAWHVNAQSAWPALTALLHFYAASVYQWMELELASHAANISWPQPSITDLGALLRSQPFKLPCGQSAISLIALENPLAAAQLETTGLDLDGFFSVLICEVRLPIECALQACGSGLRVLLGRMLPKIPLTCLLIQLTSP